MILRGIQIGNFHTAEDWDLILHAKTLTPPKPKTTYVSVPGRDGDLDLSEALTGEIHFENRIATFSFIASEGSYSDREDLLSEIVANVHGKRLQIIDPDYPGYYLSGRCTVPERTNINAYGTITVEANCDPYKYAVEETTRHVTVTTGAGTISVILTNTGVKTVTPTITVTGSVTLAFGTTSTTLSAGTYVLPGLQFPAGPTTVQVSGNGTVAFTYREGIL
jgi:phage-related protein